MYCHGKKLPNSDKGSEKGGGYKIRDTVKLEGESVVWLSPGQSKQRDGRGAKHCTEVKSGNSDGFPTGLLDMGYDGIYTVDVAIILDPGWSFWHLHTFRRCRCVRAFCRSSQNQKLST